MNNFVVGLAALVLLALGAMLVWFNGNTSAQPEEAQAGTYTSSAYGFSFSYPAQEFAVREYQPYLVAVGVPRDEDAFDSWVNVEVVSSDTEAYENFDMFLLERGKTLCAADGPGESIECSRILETLPFTSAEGAEGRELYLELLWHDLEAQSTATSTFGPVYTFAMATRALRSSQHSWCISRCRACSRRKTRERLRRLRKLCRSVRCSRRLCVTRLLFFPYMR